MCGWTDQGRGVGNVFYEAGYRYIPGFTCYI